MPEKMATMSAVCPKKSTASGSAPHWTMQACVSMSCQDFTNSALICQAGRHVQMLRWGSSSKARVDNVGAHAVHTISCRYQTGGQLRT